MSGWYELMTRGFNTGDPGDETPEPRSRLTVGAVTDFWAAVEEGARAGEALFEEDNQCH